MPRSPVVLFRWSGDSMFTPSSLQKVSQPIGCFPPAGPLGCVPRARRYYQPTLTAQSPSRRTSGLRLALPGRRSCSLPRAGPPLASLGGFFRGARTASLTRSDRTLPGSWTTRAYMPCSQTPAESRHQAVAMPKLLPSGLPNTSAPPNSVTGLYHMACTPPVYASQAGSLPHHATLGSGGWPVLTGSGLAPGGSQKGVSDWLIRSLSSPPSRLCLAQRAYDRGHSSHSRRHRQISCPFLNAFNNGEDQ